MKLLRISKDFAPDSTGNILGVDFHLGYALIDSQYYYQHLLEKGFTDVTPKWMEDIKTDLSKEDSRILTIRWGGFGDNLLVEPAIRALKEKYPNVKIDFAGRLEPRRILFTNPSIDGWFQGMKHRIAQYVGQYDDVYDFTHTIECNPESEYKDAKDIACEFVGEVPKSGMTPKIFLTKGEIAKAKQLLVINDIDINKDNIIGIHVEASSYIRSFHPSFTIKLANKLAEMNYKVILLGHNYRDIQSLHYVKCSKCKKTHEVTTSKIAFELKCKCGNKIKYALNPNIVNLIGKTKDMRVAVGVVKFLKLLIAPDSGFVHIAQATKTKTLAIYWSFDASTRCKYYKNIYVYQRPFRCAPCHLHGSKCSRWPGEHGFPPCTKIEIKEVMPLIKKLLKNKLPDFVPKNIIPKFNQKCPFCFSKKHKLLCRKGKAFYFKCLDCSSIHIDRFLNIDYLDKNYFSKIYKTKRYVRGQEVLANTILEKYNGVHFEDAPRILEIGCGIGSFIKEFKKKGWNCLGIEINPSAIKATNRKKIKTVNISFEDPKCKFKKLWYDLIVALHTIEHFKNIEASFIKMRDALYEKGRIFIACPIAEGYGNNRYGHLNTYYAGEHITLPSVEGLKTLCERLGMKIDHAQVSEKKDTVMMWISKK